MSVREKESERERIVSPCSICNTLLDNSIYLSKNACLARYGACLYNPSTSEVEAGRKGGGRKKYSCKVTYLGLSSN